MKSVIEIRKIFRDEIEEWGGKEVLGDRNNTAVLIDETYITRKRRSKGGFSGRIAEGHKTIVLGSVQSGLIFESARFSHCIMNEFKGEIKKRVPPGATVWTDGHKSYKWIGKDWRRS